ncbi:LuxR C-terminal-related transcriptional regulator [Streptomyces viridiviolaceus]|uniref:LuxR C-terminal-related transcriptional regulator n=1 Tax=Streptomyces viridiviolaceus TaxID=68282 RepID=A0ABW2ECC1_9ACTN|nr:response regulator transcription factor [Streptomyces viridiviolaceus]
MAQADTSVEEVDLADRCVAGAILLRERTEGVVAGGAKPGTRHLLGDESIGTTGHQLVRPRLAAVPSAREGAAQQQLPLTVMVKADDAITAEGAEAYLRASEAVRVARWGDWRSADMALVLDRVATERTVDWLEPLHRETDGEGPPALLIIDEISERLLLKAVRFGVVGVLPRAEVRYETVLRAAREGLSGESPMPPRLVRSLVRELRARGTSGQRRDGDLSPREVDVLRLLAEGLSTLEVADRLSYSERTIKSVLHEVVTRLKLRNRTHAVAYAIRKGLL